MKQIKEKITELAMFFNLSHRFPFYFHKKIFRFFLVMILIIGVADMWLNYEISGDPFKSYYLECREGLLMCENPFYNAHGQISERNCELLLCDSEYLPFGYRLGREDHIALYGKHLIFFLVFLAFVVNHFYYLWSKEDEV